jgi:hypothetical protein
MKNFSLSLFYLISFFTVGCEHPVDNNHINDPKTDTTAQIQVMMEEKKQKVLQEHDKTVIKTQPGQINPEYNHSPPQPEIEEGSDLTEKKQDQKVLDLSVPLRMQETITSGQTSNIENREYLPDLFSDKKNKKNHMLYFDEKLIMREDEEVEKDHIVDGVEIDINLTE